LVVTMVVAGGWQIVWSPLVDERREMEARVSQARGAAALAEEAAHQRPALAQAAAEGERWLADAMPADVATAASIVAAAVTRAVVDAGATVTRFSPRTPVETPTTVTLPVEITIDGAYPAIVRVLAAIEASPGPWLITRVRISPHPNRDSVAMRQVVVSVVALARPGGAT
jgi:Tfp pilus assembly protein PilO